MKLTKCMLACVMSASLALAACGGGAGEHTAANPDHQSASPAPAASTAGPQTPDAGGQVITVKMITDENGNYFEPAEVTAKQGDVVRYTLEMGVHNVHFLADSNSGKSGFPATPSEMLQLPGQTYDVKVTWAPGTYYYQCDPHALLGMKGHVTVK
jgi:plastocyanin